ncbi:SH3 domain-containing protein [Microvirga flavescens]|uniref:SH3 domain-containing protein n=1 Tax=Microvirga flavescens TaxID=2249811 RepID=UPI000DD5701F|nr:SH3 domain-containing protein [Microvirga flavescens]
MRKIAFTLLFPILLLTALSALPAAAQELPGGRRGTGLPVPRYVSLKTDRVNLREGPSKDHRTAWVFQRAGLPVEIIAEYETWRRIRDSEGTEGWVLHSLLSGRRTVLIMPWAKDRTPIPLLSRPDDKGDTVAQLQPGVIANIKECTGSWCHIQIALERSRDVDGYIRQDKLWGAYPNEKVE